MHDDNLRAAMADLQRQLDESENLNDESRGALERALSDIRSTLQADQQTDAERHSLVERLKLAVEEFEGSHPTLTGTLMRLVDGLGEMGI